MRTYILFQVDAFTAVRFQGNPAGVLLDADDLSEAHMLAIAREMNNSETAFLSKSKLPGADLRIRYFTPTMEVPLCGHATVASLFVRASLRGRGGPVRFETGAGVLEADVQEKDDSWHVAFTQAPPQFEHPLDAATAIEILAALGARPEDLASPLPVQIVSTGHSKVLVPLKDAATLHRLRPNAAALTELSGRIGCNGFYPFVVTSRAPFVTEGRMFAPAIGIAEDPVTGNAAGPLGAYLVQHAVAPAGPTFRLEARQGRAMGRPGAVAVSVRAENGTAAAVTIGGTAVLVFRTEITL